MNAISGASCIISIINSPMFIFWKKVCVIPIDIDSAIVCIAKNHNNDIKNIFFSLLVNSCHSLFSLNIESIGVNNIVNIIAQNHTISINLGQIIVITQGDTIKIAFHKAYQAMILKNNNLWSLKKEFFDNIKNDINTIVIDSIVDMNKAVSILNINYVLFSVNFSIDVLHFYQIRIRRNIFHNSMYYGCAM